VTPELQLVIAAASARLSATALASLERLVHHLLDWDRVVELAAIHAVRPAILRNLAPYLPERPLELLRDQCSAIKAHNLFLSGELLRVLPALDDAGISAVAFKGPVLAHRLYADVGRREFNDLDLLVPRETVWKAVEILRSLEYASAFAPDPRIRAAFLASECEVMLVHPAGHTIDLHWDFTASYYHPFPLSPAIAPATVELSGVPVLTLSAEDTALFAIGHMSRHGSWSVKEPAEMVSLFGILDDAQWERVLQRAAGRQCRRMALFAVALASRMHGISSPSAFRPFIDPCPHWLDRLLRRNLALLAEPSGRRPGALPRLDLRLRQIDAVAPRLAHAARFFLAPRPRAWRMYPTLSALVHQALQAVKPDPHPLP